MQNPQILKLIFSLFLLELLSCNTLEMSQVCEKQMPEYFASVKESYQMLAGVSFENRKIASVETPSQRSAIFGGAKPIASADNDEKKSDPELPEPLSPEERARWLSWAKDRLHETQSFMDSIEKFPRLTSEHRELERVANALVVFHGYASTGNSIRMASSLDDVLAHQSSLTQDLCQKIRDEKAGSTRY